MFNVTSAFAGDCSPSTSRLDQFPGDVLQKSLLDSVVAVAQIPHAGFLFPI